MIYTDLSIFVVLICLLLLLLLSIFQSLYLPGKNDESHDDDDGSRGGKGDGKGEVAKPFLGVVDALPEGQEELRIVDRSLDNKAMPLIPRLISSVRWTISPE